MDDETCYCQQRQHNATLAKALNDMPEGFCGVCEICGKWGHARAHPRLPVTSAWCDEHWEQLVNYRIITLADIIHWLGLILIIIISAYMVWRLLIG